MHHLLQLGCVLPVTSCEVERSFSAFRRVKTVFRSCMGEERLSSLCLMHNHYDVHINSHIVVEDRNSSGSNLAASFHLFITRKVTQSENCVFFIHIWNVRYENGSCGFYFIT